MKRLHRDDLYGWSVFDASRDIDFHSVLWQRAGVRPRGNVVVDPLRELVAELASHSR